MSEGHQPYEAIVDTSQLEESEVVESEAESDDDDDDWDDDASTQFDVIVPPPAEPAAPVDDPEARGAALEVIHYGPGNFTWRFTEAWWAAGHPIDEEEVFRNASAALSAGWIEDLGQAVEEVYPAPIHHGETDFEGAEDDDDFD
jgi:hypothetical protein